MQLDTDLGIDSIKRVEILSAVQERLPDLNAISPEQLGTLGTLRQIVEALSLSTVAAPAVAGGLRQHGGHELAPQKPSLSGVVHVNAETNGHASLKHEGHGHVDEPAITLSVFHPASRALGPG